MDGRASARRVRMFCLVGLALLWAWAGGQVAAQESGDDLDSGPAAKRDCCWFIPFEKREAVRLIKGKGKPTEEEITSDSWKLWRQSGPAGVPKEPNTVDANPDEGPSGYLLEDSYVRFTEADGVLSVDLYIRDKRNWWIYYDTGAILDRYRRGWFHWTPFGPIPPCFYKAEGASKCRQIHSANAVSSGEAQSWVNAELLANNNIANWGEESSIEATGSVYAIMKSVGFGYGASDKGGASIKISPTGSEWTYSVGINLPIATSGFVSFLVNWKPPGEKVEEQGTALPIQVTPSGPAIYRWYLERELGSRLAVRMKNREIRIQLTAEDAIPVEITKDDDCHFYHPGNAR